MVRLLRAAALLALFPASPLPAQRPALPETARRQYHDALWVLRDTVSAVAAASAGFRRDLGHAGGETVASRGLALVESCRAAVRALRRAEPSLTGHRDSDAFLRAGSRLRAVLRDDCDQRFSVRPDWTADSVRAWGPYYTAKIDRAIAEYEGAARKFTAAAGVRLEPRTDR